jgi:hypothetical protein
VEDKSCLETNLGHLAEILFAGKREAADGLRRDPHHEPKGESIELDYSVVSDIVP